LQYLIKNGNNQYEKDRMDLPESFRLAKMWSAKKEVKLVSVMLKTANEPNQTIEKI
jgi:hypothetical protein